MMLHISEVLTAAQVTGIRKAIDTAEWVDGKATVGAQGAKVKRNRQLSELSPTGLKVGQTILQALASHPLFVSAALPTRYMPPLFNRYEGGEHYGFHIDGSVRGIPGSNLSLRTDLSCTLFLSEPEDYDGGELIVADTYGEHEVKLPAGDMILYPASSVHKVEPVTRGARISSFFWVQSMVADDGKRSLLFELDQNIQKLRTKLGDTEEVIGLTGHYHNLLRQWAIV
ncbi:Fe2+-dependent dioxygenase [Herminiimonas sp. KBW02]|uniref:Fe2+-dependent dioxygenase n=1 Tax=Herminiimonas sp. KBW02 TaxID=2153363 RepID=UPI000F5963BC|nr:Fe2+-dependent dioxygenase [Herminiimonas sp. KBW02]RQO37136.1 Fe2+-dependent dioxygenase [Herminiimonas sp. KBW02]